MYNNSAVYLTGPKQPTFWEQAMFCLSILLVLCFFPFSLLFIILVAYEYERIVILRYGRLRKSGVFGPGLIFILPCIDNTFQVDLRTQALDVPAQDILTKDSVTVKVDAVVYIKFVDPLKVITQVSNIQESTEMLAQTTLRNVAGKKTLIEILSDKNSLSGSISQILDIATAPWGVKVERVEISDINLPQQLRRAMAVEQEAERAAKAKVAAAEGELKSASALKDASDIMSSNKIAIQLRYLQTLNNIANEKTKNIIFPFPTDLIKKFLSSNDANDLSVCTFCKKQENLQMTGQQSQIQKQENIQRIAEEGNPSFDGTVYLSARSN